MSKYQISLKEYSKNYLRDYVGFADQKGKRRGGRAKTKKREEKLQAQGSKPGREPRDGASWQIYTSKSGGKKQRHKRFVTTMSKSGNIIIIKRTPGSTKGGKRARAPRDYRTAYGPSLAWIDKQKNIIQPLLDSVVGPALEKNMRSQVDRFLKRKKSQRPNA